MSYAPDVPRVDFVCPDCGEVFGAPVWHCQECDHHYHRDDDTCSNCYARRPSAAPRPIFNVPVDQVVVEGRVRRDLGDLDALAGSIRTVGLLHPIVIDADRRLIAGERRLAVFKREGLSKIPALYADDIADVHAALLAERDENTCRKDFAPSEAVAMADRIEPLERAAAKERQRAHGGTAPGRKANTSEKFPEVSPTNGAAENRAQDRTAAAVGLSRPTLAKAAKVVQRGAPALIDAMDAGDVSVDQAAKLADAAPEFQRAVVETIRQDSVRPQEAMRRVLARDKAAHEVAQPSGKHRVIYADPPWSYGNTQPDYHPEQRDHYPVMSLAEICEMPVRDWVMDDAVLFLWVTSPILEDSFKVIGAWGFRYKASFVWDKVLHNMGHYNSVRHELLLVCTRGSCQPDVRRLYDSVVTEERTEHSRKPAQFYEMIETLYTSGPYLELFARESRDGWVSFGNEVVADAS